jgi:hypothetical protein
MSSPIAVALLILAPVAAFAVVGLAQRYAPGWAESHERERSVDPRLLRVERGLGCFFGLFSLAFVGSALVYLWMNRPQ